MLRRNTRHGQRGIGLAEILVALAIIGTAITAGLSAFTAGSNSANITADKLDLEVVARTQLEHTKASPYFAGSGTDVYATIPAPAGFEITVSATGAPGGNDDIQKITITVTRNSKSYTLSTFKVNR